MIDKHDNFRPHYNVNLLSISVNGQALPINPSVFSTSNGQGTIIDTGTTLAYLSEAAYIPFVEAVSHTTCHCYIHLPEPCDVSTMQFCLDMYLKCYLSFIKFSDYKCCFTVCQTSCFEREPVLRNSHEVPPSLTNFFISKHVFLLVSIWWKNLNFLMVL